MASLLEKDNQCGATAVEMALILPLLIILLFGIIEFCFIVYNKNIINNAAREGARVGIVYEIPRKPSIEIQQVVQNYLGNNLISFNPNAATIPDPEICPSGTGTGQDLTVRIVYNYGFILLPNFISNLSGGIDLNSEATMKCE